MFYLSPFRFAIFLNERHVKMKNIILYIFFNRCSKRGLIQFLQFDFWWSCKYHWSLMYELFLKWWRQWTEIPEWLVSSMQRGFTKPDLGHFAVCSWCWNEGWSLNTIFLPSGLFLNWLLWLGDGHNSISDWFWFFWV